MMPSNRVYIVGAGPVGLVTALLLCRRGIPVTILEAENTLCKDSRAAYYHAPSLDMLEDIGYLQPLLRGGQIEQAPRMFDLALRRRASLDIGILKSRYRNAYSVSAAQSWFCSVGLDLLKDYDCEIKFGHRVVGTTQNDGGVNIFVETPDGSRSVYAEWLIGCDGASSKVRKSQEIQFEGYTWPDRFVLMETKHDFGSEFGTISFLINGLDWRLVAKICYGPGSDDWTYRLVAGVQPDENDQQVLDPANLQAMLQRTMPQATPYALEGAVIYNVHQQVATTFRKDRIVLVGDAAHLNNPMGAYGLNSGIHDAFNLAEKFVDVWQGGSADALDLYDRQRRITNKEYIQKLSVENKKRNEETDLAARAAAFDSLEKMLADEESCFAFMNRWCLGESLDFARTIT